MKYIKKYLIYIVIGILVLTLSIYLNIDKTVEANQETLEEILPVEEVKIKKIKVDIKGSIANPGVYEMEEGKRVSDLIEQSGGLLWNADTSTINLSKSLKDEMVIIVYTKDEINKIKEGNKVIEYVEKECICPKLVQNDTCVEQSLEDIDKNDAVIEEVKESSKININTASIEELTTLTGIGNSKALDIIKYREENNGFKTIDEVKNISGIGEATYNKFKDSIEI